MQTLNITTHEQEMLCKLEQCLHDLLEVTKLDLYPLVVLEERCTKAQLVSNLSGYRYQGQKVSDSWAKRALIEAYHDIRIRGRKLDLMRQRDQMAQWFAEQGLGELVADTLAQAEEKRLQVVIGPPDPEIGGE